MKKVVKSSEKNIKKLEQIEKKFKKNYFIK